MAEAPKKSESALREERILSLWKERKIFEKSFTKDAPMGEFVFFEGPPTANGRPGIHHLESRAFKDALPRYKTMRGYKVRRKAGWDTHGLPVELEVEKQLGFSGKKDIEAYGVGAFNKKCRESVMAYIDEWARFTTRIGYWVDQTKAYFTFDAPYMESLFSIMKKVDADGRLYKDYRIVPWCSRCGTALSSHELAQGYEDVKDLSVTAKFELIDEPGTFLLAWTTTPWTLPGNVALAVGEKISYGLYEKEGVRVILAQALAEKNQNEGWSKVRDIPASELVGKKYKPLYPYAEAIASDTEKEKFEKAFQVYLADFVTTEDGTGIVHTAVMYGADDFALGQKLGLPKVHTVGADGKFIQGTGVFEGRFVRDEEVTVDIVKDLASRGLLFSKAKYEHSYPFCWRCKTPLIYYARDSWYIRMQDLKDTLLAENAKVNWEPEHIREGRMGEWLANVKDWAISRERYWGTPLPVWETENQEERVVVGSVQEIKERTKKSGNTYYAMRHGEAETNVAHIVCDDDSIPSALTSYGRSQALRAGAGLAGKGITRIIASPLLRGKQTAEAVAEGLGLSKDAISYDERLREVGFGVLNGRPIAEYLALFQNMDEFMGMRPEGGESWADMRRRLGEFLYDVERTYINETILVVTHGSPLRMLSAVSRGLTISEFLHDWDTARDPANAEVRTLPFVPFPHNEDYELDLHRPYIDDVELISDTGKPMRRIKEVMDVWFDSGAMPFAQDHYPFKNKERIEGAGYPADYISEAIDQTRGWFYTLLAVGVLMDKGTAYKNVSCLGHLLDKEGKKMSKSKGNVVDPWEAMDEYGVDALRFWMFSVNQAGDSKSFDPKTVKEAVRTLSWLSNSAKFYELFKDGAVEAGEEQVIDRWMNARVMETVRDVTVSMDAYKLYDATRAIERLFGDVSQWYVRRIRDRARDGDQFALSTLRHTLKNSALLLAPFSPMLAEEVFQLVRSEGDSESVHLARWPEAKEADMPLIHEMESVRNSASYFLKERQQKGVLLRQPLASATVGEGFSPELMKLLAEEINVKEILVGEVGLDTTLTPELIQEGDERAFERAVAEVRKELGLNVKDEVTVLRGEGPYEVELSTGLVKFLVTRV
jgi:isoleucyl-tRNA synthetase